MPVAPVMAAMATEGPGLTLLKYTGDSQGTFTVEGQVSKRMYQVSAQEHKKQFLAHNTVVPYLLAYMFFERVKKPEPEKPQVDMPVTFAALEQADAPAPPTVGEVLKKKRWVRDPQTGGRKFVEA